MGSPLFDLEDINCQLILSLPNLLHHNYFGVPKLNIQVAEMEILQIARLCLGELVQTEIKKMRR